MRLWTMNPDGTGQTIYFGNMHSWIVMIDAKPIPGTDQVVASFSPGHGVNEHAGIATVLSPRRGPDDQSVPKPLHQGRLTRDPYPLSADCFLVARDKEIVLMDSHGHEQVIYTYRGEGGVHEPRPIMPRPRERVVQPRTNPSQPTGRMVLADVYRGRNLPGVKRGDIRKLLVLESLPKPVNFSGGPDLVSWLGTFTLERVLGTVPVEADGSAYFEVPANRQVFFVALDEQGPVGETHAELVQRQSRARRSVAWAATNTRTETPRQSDARHAAGPAPSAEPDRAVRRLPRRAGFQPRHPADPRPPLCEVPRLHAARRPRDSGGRSGPRTGRTVSSACSPIARWPTAATALGNQPPRTIGSSASPLLKMVDGSHYDVKVTPQEWRTLWLWIESGATYVGSYAGLRNTRQQELATAATAAVFAEQAARAPPPVRRMPRGDSRGGNGRQAVALSQGMERTEQAARRPPDRPVRARTARRRSDIPIQREHPPEFHAARVVAPAAGPLGQSVRRPRKLRRRLSRPRATPTTRRSSPGCRKASRFRLRTALRHARLPAESSVRPRDEEIRHPPRQLRSDAGASRLLRNRSALLEIVLVSADRLVGVPPLGGLLPPPQSQTARRRGSLTPPNGRP